MMERTHVLGRGGTPRCDKLDVWCLIENNGSMWVEYRWYRPHATDTEKLGKRSYSISEFLLDTDQDAAKRRLVALLESRGVLPRPLRRASAEIVQFPPNREWH